MSEFIINNPLYVHLLWIVAVVGAVMAVALVYRRRAMARFATVNLHRVLVPQVSARRRWTKALLLAGALAAMTAALVDVRWGRTWREVPQRGVDVMFVLDVSHSMLAQDASPTRLGRAKQDILDIVHDMQGDRVGLVTFAGDTAQKTPLTSNYREFQLMLDEVGPHSVSRGGSDLGRALEMAARGFIDKSANHKAIVVFSDGEDQDSKPTEIAKSLFEKRGIRIFTVGLGDDQKGARIPMRSSDGRQAWLQYDGQDVWTKMNGKVLQDVALAANGAYVPAGTQHVSMDQVYKQHIASIEQQEYEQARVNTYIPRYQWFVGLALLLAGAEVLLRDVKKIRMPKSVPATVAAVLAIAVTAVAPAPSFAAVSSPAANPSATHAAANPGTPEKQPGAVAGTAEAGSPEHSEPIPPATPEAAYNQAVELYRAGKTDEAGSLWSEVAQSGKPELAAKSHFNLGNCSYSAAAKLKDQQPEQAMQQLDTAIAHYRDSLKLNRADQDARVNIELAARLREQLRRQEEQKKQQQQQKDQQKQDQQKQEQQQQSQQDQQQKQDQNQQQQDQQQNQQKDQQQKNDQQQQSQNQQQNQQQDKQDQQQQQDDKQQQQDQSSQSQQNQDQKSDSKQDQQQDQKNSSQQQDEHKADQQQSKEREQKQEQQSSEQKKQPEQQPQQDQQESPKKEQSTKDQPKQEQPKQDPKSSPNSEQEKQPESKQQQKQQDAHHQQQPEQKQPEQKQPGQKKPEQQPQDQPQDQKQQPGDKPKPEQQQQQQQPKQQPSKAKDSHSPADQQHAERGERDQNPSDQPEAAQKDDRQKPKPEIKPGQKLEPNGTGTPPAGSEEISDAELKDPKAMSKDEAAKMLQAIRDRDLLRRIQQLRKEQSQRRPVDKDW